MSAAQRLRTRLRGGDNLLSMGAWDVLSAKVIERSGFDMAAIQSFQWAAGWGLPDLGLATPSDLVLLTMKTTGEVSLPVMVDFEEGFGSPGHAAYWTRQFERAGAAALHVDDKGPVHMCPWLPGSESKIQVSPVEHTRDIIRAMADARQGDLLIVARTQVGSTGAAGFEQEEISRLHVYIEAGADVVYAPKAATMANDLVKLGAAVRELPAPMLVQFNPPGYIENYVPRGGKDGKSIADRSFEDLFSCGVRIVNSPQLNALAYRAFGDVLTEIRRQGRLEPARAGMPGFSEMLDLLGYDRFRDEAGKRPRGKD